MPATTTILRPLAWCLGLGAAATVLAPTAGVTVPVAMIALLASGAAGNFGHELCEALQKDVADRLFSRRSGLAESRVVVQALRQSQLAALDDIGRRFDAAHAARPDFPGHAEAARFSAELANFIVAETKVAATGDFFATGSFTPDEDALRQQVLTVLPDAFDQDLAARRAARDPTAFAESFALFRRLVEQAVLAELALNLWSPGETPPAPFLDLFTGSATQDGWFSLFLRSAGDRLKASADGDGKFAATWAAEQTALLKAIADSHTALLHDIKSDTANIRDSQVAEAEVAERRHRELMDAIAREKGVDPAVLTPLFAHLGQDNLSVDQMRTQAKTAISEILARASAPVPQSNDGADIAATVAAARAHLGRLDTAAARAVLTAKIAEEDTSHRQRSALLLEERAAVEQLTHDYASAEATLHESLDLDPHRPWVWIELGNLQEKTGSLELAHASYCSALAAAEWLTKSDPGNDLWLYDLSMSHVSIGEVRKTQGKLDEALENFQIALEFGKKLLQSDVGYIDGQRSLTIAHSLIGDVRLEQGNTIAAVESYKSALETSVGRSRTDKNNLDWQRDLLLCYMKLGDIYMMQEQLDEALHNYQDSLAIAAHLVQQDSDNDVWWGDLSVAKERMGHAQLALKNLAAASESYRESLGIAVRLSQSDPHNMDWLGHLSSAHMAIGSIQDAMGDHTGALESYELARRITAGLSQSDIDNANWQRTLAAIHERIAATYQQNHQPSRARESLGQSLEIYGGLISKNPDDFQSNMSLVGSLLCLSEVDPTGAEIHLTSALAILESLAAARRLDANALDLIPQIRAELASRIH